MKALFRSSKTPLTQTQLDRFTKAYAFVMFSLVPAFAHAYMGGTVVNFARDWIIAPLAVIMIIITIGAAMFKPEAAKQAGYVAIVAVVLFLLMAQADTIIGAIKSSGN
jgi:hypothetical protein